MRKLCLISSELGSLLVKQVAHELKNFNLYKSFANFFGVEGISDLEEYYNKRAIEEKNHSEWIYSYLTDGDYKFLYPIVELNTEKYEQYIDPFILTVDREILTTQLIYKIYEQAVSEKDYMTASWLYEKLIKEQVEEENISRMAVTIMSMDADIFVSAEEVLKLLE
jgi:ferritin